jgi:hypothetical protein
MLMEGQNFKEVGRYLGGVSVDAVTVIIVAVTAAVDSILPFLARRWSIVADYGLQFSLAVVVVLINIQDELDFLLGLFWGRAKTMGST